jgi:hypothetical protein
VKVHAVHLLSWKILAFVLRSWTSFLIVCVSSCTKKKLNENPYMLFREKIANN